MDIRYSSLEEKLSPAQYAIIISTLMLVSPSLLRVKMTFGNWPGSCSEALLSPLALRQKDLTHTFGTAVWCYISSASKGRPSCDFIWQ
jgi:hypothetical protein